MPGRRIATDVLAFSPRRMTLRGPGNTLGNNGDKLDMEFVLQLSGAIDGSQSFESTVTFNDVFIFNDWSEAYFGSTGGNRSNVNVRVLFIEVSNSVVHATSTTNSNITVQVSPVTMVFPQAEPPGSFKQITGLDLSTSYDIILQRGNRGTGARRKYIRQNGGHPQNQGRPLISFRSLASGPYAQKLTPCARSRRC